MPPQMSSVRSGQSRLPSGAVLMNLTCIRTPLASTRFIDRGQPRAFGREALQGPGPGYVAGAHLLLGGRFGAGLLEGLAAVGEVLLGFPDAVAELPFSGFSGWCAAALSRWRGGLREPRGIPPVSRAAQAARAWQRGADRQRAQVSGRWRSRVGRGVAGW